MDFGCILGTDSEVNVCDLVTYDAFMHYLISIPMGPICMATATDHIYFGSILIHGRPGKPYITPLLDPAHPHPEATRPALPHAYAEELRIATAIRRHLQRLHQENSAGWASQATAPAGARATRQEQVMITNGHAQDGCGNKLEAKSVWCSDAMV